MLEIEDINKANPMQLLPRDISYNKEVILDTRLFKILSDSEEAERDNTVYDFNVYLPDYGINLQREYVWKHHQQNNFIVSLLLEKPIEKLVVVQHEKIEGDERKRINYVIDGKQRLLTIYRFLHNRFSIEMDGKEFFWEDFSEDTKSLFRRCVNCLTATIFYSDEECPVTDEMKIRLFNYYNFSGTPQDETHKNMLQKLIKNEEREANIILKKRGYIDPLLLNQAQLGELTDIANSLAEQILPYNSLTIATSVANITFDFK